MHLTEHLRIGVYIDGAEGYGVERKMHIYLKKDCEKLHTDSVIITTESYPRLIYDINKFQEEGGENEVSVTK